MHKNFGCDTHDDAQWYAPSSTTLTTILSQWPTLDSKSVQFKKEKKAFHQIEFGFSHVVKQEITQGTHALCWRLPKGVWINYPTPNPHSANGWVPSDHKPIGGDNLGGFPAPTPFYLQF